jgi:hypothetical protein
MRRLLGNVVSFRAVRVVPVSSEDLAQNGVERLLNSSVLASAAVLGFSRHSRCLRRLDVPPAQVELCHGDESLDWIVDCCQREEGLGMGHEAVLVSVCVLVSQAWVQAD